MFSRSSLAGKVFLITRTSEGNIVERKLLESYGARVRDFPAISISSPSSLKKLDDAISTLEKFDWIVFTSSNGVEMFFERLERKRGNLISSLKLKMKPRFACVGPSTLRALTKLGLRCSALPNKYLTAELGRVLAKMNIAGKNILLARAEISNKEIVRIIRRSGAYLTEVAVYRTVSGNRRRPPDLGDVTDLTLTSPSTLDGLLLSIKAEDINTRGIRVHCIGPVTAKHARLHNLKISTVASTHTIDGLINTILENSIGTPRTV